MLTSGPLPWEGRAQSSWGPRDDSRACTPELSSQRGREAGVFIPRLITVIDEVMIQVYLIPRASCSQYSCSQSNCQQGCRYRVRSFLGVGRWVEEPEVCVGRNGQDTRLATKDSQHFRQSGLSLGHHQRVADQSCVWDKHQVRGLQVAGSSQAVSSRRPLNLPPKKGCGREKDGVRVPGRVWLSPR